LAVSEGASRLRRAHSDVLRTASRIRWREPQARAVVERMTISLRERLDLHAALRVIDRSDP